MTLHQVRETCRQIMAGPPPVTGLRDFCARLGEQRGRQIQLIPFVADADTPSGLWVKAQQLDFVFYDGVTSPVHQDAIIWHEVSHLLLDHPGPVMDEATARLLLPDLDPVVVMRMLNRDSYSHAVEREAEELASLLMLDQADAGRATAARRTGTLLDRLKGGLNYRDEAR